MKKFLLIITFFSTYSFCAISTSPAPQFEKAWEFELNYSDPFYTVQAQPKEYLNKLLFVDGLGNLFALDKQQGKLLYKIFLGNKAGRRGFSIDQLKGEVIITASGKLFVLDAETGEIKRSVNTATSLVAPAITNDCYIVIGGGDIRCHEKNLKKIKWKTELGITARVWSNPLFSDKYNLLYFVTSNPGGVVFDNNRVDNYSSSLIALDVLTGAIHFAHRMVQNDVWDFDGVGQPIVIKNFQADNDSKIDLLVGMNKTGTLFAVNAKDGSEVKDNQFERIAFPAYFGKEALEENTQIIPTWPARLSNIKISKDDLRLEELDPIKLRYAKFQEFLRPTVNYDVVTKGLHGGPEWHGGIYYEDVKNNQKLLAAPTNNIPWILRVQYVQQNPLLLKVLFRVINAIQRIKIFFFSDSDVKEINSNFSDSRWKRDIWSNSDLTSSVTNYFYKNFDFKSHNKVYKQNCASCHGYDRRGKYQSELIGDGYVPSLVGHTLTEKYTFSKTYENFKLLHGGTSGVSRDELKNLFEHFHKHDENLFKNNKLHKEGFWQVLLGKDLLPLNKDPWGNVTIIDLVSGELRGSIPVGESLGSSNKIYESSIIFGGLGNPNDQGNTMLTGTINPVAYYLSLPEARVISTLKLKRPGSVNPFLTNINNCEAWIFVETGGQFSFYDRSMNGFTIEAFINRDNCSKV
jgi:hypothetical protein